ncbi:MAG: sensor histidine kinase [Nitrospinota bacterium]
MDVRPLRSFSLLSALLWAACALALAIGLAFYAEHRMLREVSLTSLDYFRAVTRVLPTDAELRRIREGDNLARLEKALAPLLRARKVVTIKLYDDSGRLLYHSRAPDQVGKIFPKNPNLEKALSGESALSLSDLSAAEHAVESALGHGRLLELYLPIRDSNSGSVIGAYEIYTSFEPLFRRLWRQRAIVWGAVLAGALVLYAGLFLHFKRASRTIARDLMERKTLEREVIHQEKLAGMGLLAAGLAHQIGNPLGIIASAVQFCLDSLRPPEPLRRHLVVIQRNVADADKTLKALLRFARPAPLAVGRIDLKKLLHETCELLKGECSNRGIIIAENYPPKGPLVMADRDNLQPAFMSLLVNALEAIGRDGTIRVQLEVDEFARQTCVTVADTGPGIPPEDLERVFDPFFTTREEGTGLGLAICQRVVESHGGRVTAANGATGGALLRVTLPLERTATEGAPGNG